MKQTITDKRRLTELSMNKIEGPCTRMAIFDKIAKLVPMEGVSGNFIRLREIWLKNRVDWFSAYSQI
ncbi:hypothetical protein [Maribacter sp. 2304DJ31-5]|uniref:hypothetical protein n=1 Tax=Maribacter sp. 2304DJ31-5 TaxID=3386273 RepID=UPI0039BD0A61